MQAASHFGLLAGIVTLVSHPLAPAATCTVEAGKYWPGGIVPFAFDDNVTPENVQRMLDAMAVWESASRVVFVPHTGELNWLHIRDHVFDGAEIGKQGIGFQMVNVQHWDRKFRLAHLLGHSLGLLDENERNIAFDYISWDLSRFNGDRRKEHFGLAFNLVGLPTLTGFGDYDFDSVMHPDQCAYSFCGDTCEFESGSCSSLILLPPYDDQWHDRVGNQEHLSAADQLIMNFLYPPSDWRVVNPYIFAFVPNPIENGTLIEPYRTLEKGLDETPDRGTVWAMPGQYGWHGVLSKPVTLRCPPVDERIVADGTIDYRRVVLGRNP